MRDSISSSSLLPGGQGEAESSNPLFNQAPALLATSPPLLKLSKGSQLAVISSIHKTHSFTTREIPWVLGAVCQESRTKFKYLHFVI